MFEKMELEKEAIQQGKHKDPLLSADRNLLNLFHRAHAAHENYRKPRFDNGDFIVKHYAGEVTYDITNFVEKNKDELSVDIEELFTEKTKFEQIQQLAKRDAENHPSSKSEVGMKQVALEADCVVEPRLSEFVRPTLHALAHTSHSRRRC